MGAISNWKCISPASASGWSQRRTSPGCHYPLAESMHVDCLAQPIWSCERRTNRNAMHQWCGHGNRLIPRPPITAVAASATAGDNRHNLKEEVIQDRISHRIIQPILCRNWNSTRQKRLTGASWCCDTARPGCGPPARNCAPRYPTVQSRYWPPVRSSAAPPGAMRPPPASLRLGIHRVGGLENGGEYQGS